MTREIINQLATLEKFIGKMQIAALIRGLRGEEKTAFIEIIGRLLYTIETMPETYGQDGKGDAAIVYLHYFRGSMDWYITERDVEDIQYQAFGLADLGYGAELGYISIAELIQCNVELDFYWTPKTLAEIKAENAKK
mgnify:CR=1 FL=1